MIKLYAAHGTSNLGDFLNCLPVLSGISKFYGEISLVIQNDMRKFVGIKDLLSYQKIFCNVSFEDEVKDLRAYIPFNNWSDDMSFDGINPIETTRYKRIFNKIVPELKFEIDSEFELMIPKLKVVTYDRVIGDRCINTTADTRRACGVLENVWDKNDPSIYYLDYRDSIIYNANLMLNALHFDTTFTGVSIIADLLKIGFNLYYTEDFDGWAGQKVEFTYQKHFYKNRFSRLKLLGGV